LHLFSPLFPAGNYGFATMLTTLGMSLQLQFFACNPGVFVLKGFLHLGGLPNTSACKSKDK
jgi:hypothetical protein